MKQETHWSQQRQLPFFQLWKLGVHRENRENLEMRLGTHKKIKCMETSYRKF